MWSVTEIFTFVVVVVVVCCKDQATPEKPNCILEYNGQMGGVDKCDQLIQPYDATRRSLIWYKKLCIHLLQLAMLNAHIVYKSSNKEPRLSFMDFTKEVIHSLLFQHDGEASPASQPEDLLRVTGHHFPQKVAPTGAKALPQKRCKVCCRKGVRRESRYTCDSCPSQPGLCVEPCFKTYHTKNKYWQ